MNKLMNKLRALLIRIAGLFRRREDDLSQEIESHLQLHIDDNLRAGMTPAQARREALLKLGGIETTKENYRDRWSLPWLEHLIQDLRYGIRQLRRSPGFTSVAVLSLALGIGANTAIFSFMDAILLRSLPVQDPESLVAINWRAHGQSRVIHMTTISSTGSSVFPYAALQTLRAQNRVCSDVFAFSGAGRLTVSVRDQTELANAELVSGDFFGALGVPPAAGRLIDANDDRAGAAPVAVISFQYWQKRFGRRASVIGEPIQINNWLFTLAGIAPPEFYGVDPGHSPDVYVPFSASNLIDLSPEASIKFTNENFYWVQMMGRLRPGVSRMQAQAAMAPAFQNFVTSTAKNDQERANLPALFLSAGATGLDSLRNQYSKPLYVLLAMVALILAIACANTANLLLARAAVRRKEIALRLGMGASRFRVIRQLLTESVLLSSLGGALGVLFAVWGIRSLTFLLANGRDNFTLHAELNWHVLGATTVLSVITGLLFGLAPALEAARVDLAPALKEGASAVRARFRHFRVSMSQGLVASQIALSLLLLVGAGLFVRTLSNLQSVPLGFDPENLLLFTVNGSQAGLKGDALTRFYRDLGSRLRSAPGVRSVSSSNVPLVSGGMMILPVKVPGAPPGKNPSSPMISVGPGFLTTMQIPILLGRDLDERDIGGARAAAVVNEEFAKTYFGDENSIGRHFQAGTADFEIAGVAKNARYDNLKKRYSTIAYLAYGHGFPPMFQMTYELRSARDPLALATAVQQIVHQANPRVPVANIKTQSAQIDQTINQERVFAMLCSCFAVLALLIACVGLYGTMSYAVARRSNEIGIRMALGAQRPRVVWMILRGVLAMSVAGLAIGLPIAYATSKYVESFLFKMKPNDPLTVGAAVGILLASAILAGYLPARRASRIDPMEALRHE